MTDPFKTWADAWTANQQAMMKSMFPLATTEDARGDAVQAPLDEQFKELRDTWQASIQKWTEFAKSGVQSGLKGGALTPEGLNELFGPAAWSGAGAGAFDAGLRQVLEGPKYATLWDHDRKLLELQQRAVERDKDVAAYQGVVQRAWNTAFERFSTSFAAAKAEAPATWRGLTDRWLKVVNDTLVEVHRSEEFLEAQRRMLRSASEYRLQERKIAEAWCETSHIPTRTEMDDLQRTVTELKRQVRELQREKAAQLAAVETASAARPKPIPKHKPKPKPASAVRQSRASRSTSADSAPATKPDRPVAPRSPTKRAKASPARGSTRRSTRA